MGVNTVKGWIIDTPQVLIKSKKGDLHLTKTTSGEISFTSEDLNIAAGWSFLDLAQIQKSSKIDIKIVNAEFDIEQLGLQSGGTISQKIATIDKFGKKYTANETGILTIPYAVVAGSIRVNGFKPVITAIPAEGEFTVTIADSTTTVLFTEAEANMTFTPAFQILTTVPVTVLETKETDVPGSGECIVEYPVYESEDIESAITGYAQIHIFKAKIKQSSKMGGSYKSASTFDLDLSALASGREDGMAWSFTYNPLEEA